MRAEDFSHQAAHREQTGHGAPGLACPDGMPFRPARASPSAGRAPRGGRGGSAGAALFPPAAEPLPYAIPHRDDWKHNLFLVDKVRPTPRPLPAQGTPTRNPRKAGAFPGTCPHFRQTVPTSDENRTLCGIDPEIRQRVFQAVDSSHTISIYIGIFLYNEGRNRCEEPCFTKQQEME